MHFSPATVSALQGWQVAITGASGWMGRALVEMLHHAAVPFAAFTSDGRSMTLRDGTIIACQPIARLSELPNARWLLAHCAYGTKDRVTTQGHGAFTDANAMLTQQVSEAISRLQPKAIFFPSSGAVYAKDGSLDHDMERNPYGVQKHRDEAHFVGLAQQVGARICIPRLFNMSGPYINKWPAYALADLICQALDGKTLHIQSPGPVVRSYVHVRDVLELAIASLLAVTIASPIRFDTRGECDVEIAQLAHAVETALCGATRSMLRTADATLAGSIYLGAAEPMRQLYRQLGMTPLPLAAQIADTAAYITHERQREAA